MGLRVLGLTIVAVGATLLVTAGPSQASPPAPDSEEADAYPRFEHHGYFRFRADLFYGGTLETVTPGSVSAGGGGIAAPLAWNVINQSPEAHLETQEVPADVIAGANLRLRYQPTIHLHPTVRVFATLDVLDNLIMGATPDFLDGTGGISFFSQGQDSPTTGLNSGRDAISLKEAYIEWEPLLLFRVGRQAHHWGLGVLASGGAGHDDDHGDYTDRVMVQGDVGGVRIRAAYDAVFSGAISDDPGLNYGQPGDLGLADNVHQFLLTISSTGADAAPADAPVGAPRLDWGVYAQFRHQASTIDATDLQQAGDLGGRALANDINLQSHEGWALIPDLWLRYQHRLDDASEVRLEIELLGIFGNLERQADASDSMVAQGIQQMGGALEFSYRHRGLTVGLDAGAATGDPDAPMGGSLANLGATDATDATLTALRFDPDYHVDLILFREVLGTVSNAVYVKPHIAYDLFEGEEGALGARLDVLLAHAIEAEATPGGAGLLGAEVDLRLFYRAGDTLRLDLETGLLIPGDALSARGGSPDATVQEPGLAFTLQGRLTTRF